MTVPDSVIDAIRAAVNADPQNNELRVHLASLLFDNGKINDAAVEVGQVLVRQPDHSAARAIAEQIAKSNEAESTAAPLVSQGVPETADDLIASWGEAPAPNELVAGSIERPLVRLSDVAGLQDVKARLERSLFGPMRNPELAAQYGASMRGGLLLYGPPGCGKTFLARAIASELGANFYGVGLSEILDMWIGSSERNLHQLFEVARAHQPCVLFFDEVDALGLKRSQLTHQAAMRGVVNQFLYELDGIGSENHGVYIIAATNHPWDVDEALLRPGRLGRLVLVTPPDEPARAEILKTHLSNRPQEAIDFQVLAKTSEGRSGADLAAACEYAAEHAFEQSLESGKSQPITTKLMKEAIDATKPSFGGWLESAKSVATFANSDGRYDDLIRWLKQRR